MQNDHEHRRSGSAPDVINFFFIRTLAVLIVLFFSIPQRASAEHLTASGCSVSNTGYLTELAREYERRTGVKIFVRGGGSVVGIEDLRSGKVDFAAACRSRHMGDPQDIEFIQIAWDALVFIVHRSSPVTDISLESIRAIYAGRITDWQALGAPPLPIKVFVSRTRQGLSGVEASTKALVLNGEDPVESPNMLFAASTGIVEQLVEETPGGFATTGITSARKRDVSMLRVNGVAPTNKAIIRGRYPMKRPLFLLVPKKAKPAVKRFVDFALSADGQNFLRSLNVIALRDIR